MFSDSEVAKKVQLSKTKIGYYITFGIAPYFRSLPLQDIQNKISLNKIFQEEKKDVQTRYCNKTLGLAGTRYFDLQYMLRPNANSLVKALENSTP